MGNLTEMLKGILEGCVLEVISQGETYGYEITRKLNDLGFEDVVEGTVYTILLRFEKANLVSCVKRPSPAGPSRKFYSLTPDGESELEAFWRRWDFLRTHVDNMKGGN